MNTELENKNLTSNDAEPVLCTVVIPEYDWKAIKRIRNYFRENDKTMLEHLAYDVLDRIVKQLDKNNCT